MLGARLRLVGCCTPSAGGLAIALVGNGVWSLDALLGLTSPDWLPSAWLALMAIGAVLALVARAIFAPKPVPQKA